MVSAQFQREWDGSVVARYRRGDGTETWERQKGDRAIYFPVHDIVHYCVESVLQLPDGFFGLIAAGWDVREMDGKHSRGRLPAESILVEKLVGLFTAEFTSAPLSAVEINSQMREYARADGAVALREFSDLELAEVRGAIHRLRAAWTALPAGKSFDLEFELDDRNGRTKRRNESRRAGWLNVNFDQKEG